MKTRFHFQSMLIGAVFSAAMLVMILPTFGQGSDRANAQDLSINDGQAQAKQNNEAVTLLVEHGRYQIVTAEEVAYLLDTETGQVWKDQRFTTQPRANRGFYEAKD